MKNFWACCVAISLLAACKPGIPKDVLQPGKITLILYNIHLADGYINTLPGRDSAKKTGAAYYRGIYKKFDTDSAAYARSMNYYFENPVLLDEIYGEVTRKLQAAKDREEKLDIRRRQKENKKKNEPSAAQIKAVREKAADSLKRVQHPDTAVKIKISPGLKKTELK